MSNTENLGLWRKEHRQRLIVARMEIPVAERSRCGDAISHRIAQHEVLKNKAIISFYWPFKGELDFRPLVTVLHAKGHKLALPVVEEKAAPMVFRPWQPQAKMTRGIWNIPIPDTKDTIIPDITLAPLVGYDDNNYRLGYGGGYFDRTIASLNPRPYVIGVGFSLQHMASIRPQTYDIAMDEIMVEDAVV